MHSGTLKKRVGHLTLANQLTFLRLVAVPFFILAILEAKFGLALILFLAAGLTDLFDGLVARVFQQRTALGYRCFWCASCRRRFNERTGTPFNGLRQI